MTNVLQPFHFLVTGLAGWFSRHQQTVIDYLIEENRVLMDQLDGERLRFTDEQRIRLMFNINKSSLISNNCGQIWHYSTYTIT